MRAGAGRSLGWLAILGAALALWGAPQVCVAQTATLEASPGVVENPIYLRAIELARELIERRIAEGVPGFSVAVAIDGQTVWVEAQGLADVEQGRPATPATRFRIGSTSKSVTSALAGRLLDAGLIDLDADIRDVFPEFPEKRYSLSLYDLLSNQSGIRHYRGLESRNRVHFGSVAQGLQLFQADSLLFEPHSSVGYSSYAFNLAGAVMAKAAGLSFGELVLREVFEPLGMRASGVDDPTVDVPERATFYSGSGDDPRRAMYVDDSYKAPSGGLLSTPSDLVTFGSALLSGVTLEGDPWLSAETVQLLFSARPTADGQNRGYALGFRVQAADSEADPAVPHAVHHGGSSVGGRSMFYMLPDHGIVVSLLCNSDDYRTKEDDAAAIARFFAEVSGGNLEARIDRAQSGRVSFRYDTNVEAQRCEWRRSDRGSSPCWRGPAEVTLTSRGNEVVDLDVDIVRDNDPPPLRYETLGKVMPGVATEYLLGLVEQTRPSVAADAIGAAAMAEGVEVWPRLLVFARDTSLDTEVRQVATFWVGQASADEAVSGLREIVQDDPDSEVRQSAVFALSQHDGVEVISTLMEIAQDNVDPEVRRSAFFWLAQRDDPKVLDFFERVLRGSLEGR